VVFAPGQDTSLGKENNFFKCKKMDFGEKKQGYVVLGRRDDLKGAGKIDLRSRLFLYFSILLLIFAFAVILLDGIGFFIYASRLGRETIIAYFLFMIGLAISFFCVPILYWSSFHKFKDGDGFWESESFWILPLFFFGAFFQYIGNLPYSAITLPFSLILVFFVHIRVMLLSKSLIIKNEQFENTAEYFKTFIYLTAYYLILAVGVVFFRYF